MTSKGISEITCIEKRMIFNKNKDLLKKYLEFIYDDLLKKENEKYFTKLIFRSYLNFPSIISENLFRVFSKSSRNKISSEDFVRGLIKLMTYSKEKIMRLIFLMSDFETTGSVFVEDLRLILRFLDYYTNSNNENQSLEKQFDLLFKNSESNILSKIDERDFVCILNNNKQFTKNVFECLMNGIPFSIENILILRKEYLISESKSLKSKIGKDKSPLNSAKEHENLCATSSKKSNEKMSNKLGSETKQLSDATDENIETDEEEKTISVPSLKSTRKLIQIKNSSSGEQNDTISECSRNTSFKSNIFSIKDYPKVNFGGFVYNKVNSQQIQLIWIKVINRDIYIFNSDKTKILNIIHISTSYAEIGSKETFGQSTLFSFFVNFKNSCLTFFCKTLQECENFISQINMAKNYREITDHYDFGEVIGKGHFSEVRLGYSKENKSKVSIKIISKKNLKTDELESILAEVEILQICNHKNIGQVIDTFNTVDTLYIVLEYIENGTLFEFLIKNHDILTYQMIKQFIREIAEGINYLHENNIMHRDLKPENIMINESKEVKIVDLGFGKIIGKEQKIHERLGTLSYIAPEVYQSKGYNREADIWSLGLIVYYLLSGSIAFENGDQAVSFLEKANFDNERFYSGLTNSNVSKNGRDLVMKCLNEQHKRINIKQFLQHKFFERM